MNRGALGRYRHNPWIPKEEEGRTYRSSSYPHLFLHCWDKTLSKSNVENKVFVTGHSPSEGNRGSNLEAGIGAKEAEGCCLLACSLWLTLTAFIYSLGIAAQAWYPPKWAEPFHNKHKLIKCPKDFPMCQYDGGNFSNEVSCSLVCQVDNWSYVTHPLNILYEPHQRERERFVSRHFEINFAFRVLCQLSESCDVSVNQSGGMKTRILPVNASSHVAFRKIKHHIDTDPWVGAIVIVENSSY